VSRAPEILARAERGAPSEEGGGSIGLPAADASGETRGSAGDGDVVMLREVAAPWCRIPQATLVLLAMVPEDSPCPLHEARIELDIELPPAILRSVLSRRRSFLAGRASVMLAMRRHGMAEARSPAIADHRGPLWPSGIVGSISHSATHAVALVASDSVYRGIGIDLEECMTDAMVDSVAPLVASEVLDGSLHVDCASENLALAVTAVFSAKESLFKCLRPLTDDFFDFSDASMIALDFASQRGRLRLRRTLAPSIREGLEVDVDVHAVDGMIHTMIAWPG
jgi:enterobactin synthetase component D